MLGSGIYEPMENRIRDINRKCFLCLKTDAGLGDLYFRRICLNSSGPTSALDGSSRRRMESVKVYCRRILLESRTCPVGPFYYLIITVYYVRR